MIMISSNRIHNVLKLVLAGKTDTPPAAPAAEAAPETAEQETSYVVYMYFAPKDKAIDFKTISVDIKNAAKSKALLENLQSEKGTPAPYSAGYFSWKKVLVVTNRYDNAKKKYIVYSADVDNMGTIEAGSEEIYPESNYPTEDQVKEDFNLFKNGILNLQTNVPGQYEVYYLNGQPQENLSKLLIANPKEATKGESYNEFLENMDKFRIWTTNGLVRPDFKKSNNDGVPGGYYPGGQKAFQEVILSMVKEQEKESLQPVTPTGPSLKEKGKEEEESRFEAAPKKTAPVKGDYLDTPPQGVKMANMRISTRKVMLEYLKNAQYSMTPPGTTPQTTTSPGKKTPLSFPLGQNVLESEQNKKNMEKAIQMQKDQQKLVQQAQKPTTQTGKYS